jgi:peptide deformylase
MIITDEKLLREPCEDSNVFEAQSIINRLEKELENSKISGVGLAAPQIGIKKKVCIIRTKDEINLINPVIIEKYDLAEFKDEGCLSFPDQYVLTKRYNEVFVRDIIYPAGIILIGIDAVVAQHEIDHLYGKIMFEHQIKRPKVNEKCWCKSGKKYKKCHIKKVIK